MQLTTWHFSAFVGLFYQNGVYLFIYSCSEVDSLTVKFTVNNLPVDTLIALLINKYQPIDVRYLFVFSCSEVDLMTVKINVNGEPTIDVCVFVCFQL